VFTQAILVHCEQAVKHRSA